MNRYISLIFAISWCMIMSMHTDARKIKTKLPAKAIIQKVNTTEQREKPEITIACDSCTNFNEIIKGIKFYGFDKTVSSSMESFFISNSTDYTIKKITLEITYRDLQDRQLHKRAVSFDCEISSGQTQRQDIKSWDSQKSFYYYKSAKPRRQATPFTVTISLKTLEYSHRRVDVRE